MALSERQSKILDFLKIFTLDNGYPPTIREIGKAVGISSTSVVNYNLDALQRTGYIYRDRTVSRGIRLAEGLEGVAGATNLVTGIATAMMDSSPIVCITGQVPSAVIGSDAF